MATAPSAPYFAEFRHVTHRFAATGATALLDIDLSIPAGQFVAIVGASGCGKTTLLNMLAGLITPSSGEVTMKGRAPRCPDPDVAYMYARDSLLPWRTAIKNVELGLEARGWSSHDRRRRAEEMLRLVGLLDKKDFFRLQLSQGMRQRIAIARTLALDPEVILMDEPFAALDARTKLEMQVEFLRIWEATADSATRPRTVFFVTHDLQEAALVADRVIVMRPSPGHVALDMPIDLGRPRAERVTELMFDPRFVEIQGELFRYLEGAMPEEASSIAGAAHE